MRTLPARTSLIPWAGLLLLVTTIIAGPARGQNQDLTFSLGGIPGQTRSFQGFAGNEARITWALHPVYNQLGVPWTLPPIRWGPAIIICIALGFPALLILALLITAVANHA